MKKLFLVFAMALTAFAEDFKASGSVTRTSQAPEDIGYQTVTTIASSTVTYVCVGPSRRKEPATLTVSTISNANPGVMTITAHGFNASATPMVLISGATGNWAPINGQHILTYSSANAMTLNVNTSTFGTFVGQTITVTTYAVRETDALWAVQKKVYNATPVEIWRGWASGADDANQTSPPDGGTALMKFACSNRATLGYQ